MDAAEAQNLLGQVARMQEELHSLRAAQGQVRVIFPPRERKIQKFSGSEGKDGDPYQLTDFLTDVKAVWDDRQGITPADKASVIVSNLEGVAREEIKCLSADEQRDPDKVEATLKAAFSEKATVSQLMAGFYSRKQKANETLQQYSLALKQLARRIQAIGGTTSGVTRDVFMENLHNKQLRCHLKQQVRLDDTLTFEAALQAARHWEEDLQDSPSTNKRSASIHQQDAVGSCPPQGQSDGIAQLSARFHEQQQALTELTATLQQLLKREDQRLAAGQGQDLGQGASSGPYSDRAGPRRDKQRVVCYRCNKPGHIASRCRKETRAPSGMGNGRPQTRANSNPNSSDTATQSEN